jgi:hypothetical protein
MTTQLKADFTGAFHKSAISKCIPKATKHAITQWATDTVMMLKKSAAAQQRSGPGRKTGHMGRNVGMESSIGDEAYKIVIGTGVGGTQTVKYASVQDKGGTIKAKKKFLTIPLPGVKGVARNYPNAFLCTTAGGQWMLAEPKGKTGIRPLFLLRPQVTLPASHWFSGIADAREKDLAEAIRPEHVLKIAEGMARGAGV